MVVAIEDRLISLLETSSMDRATFVRLLLLLASSSDAPGVMSAKLRECLEAEALTHISSYLKSSDEESMMSLAALIIGCSQLSLSSLQLATTVQEVTDERVDDLMKKLGDLENIANLLLIQATTRSSHLALTAQLISNLETVLAKEGDEGVQEDEPGHMLTALWSLVALGHGQNLDAEGRLPEPLSSLLLRATKWQCLDDPKMERQLQQISLNFVLEHGEKPEVASQMANL
ncbi:hypothetical protein Pmar_PMAR024340 [Perkinsus marinus ATCC 50983]|uniref:Uncharacterized protein n=1 Tax=Perkinsus marinus (strain ATCC 50983 / TXsc) TaxID=423536 RepID=C5LMK5_PERM5|nr:hypothetical protein Pmar_PMAR024340 [Perkinsus marinus ATCC 50983]EER02022.1 hypothetical protein Pmar_PMAR024340 [Perkinsus marinus ATCC 50983]|eukprot:XP_002769304.1 hypothetical protein Pmar_PMAR024340 [Perkinsus marinus ATCC 50983]